MAYNSEKEIQVITTLAISPLRKARALHALADKYEAWANLEAKDGRFHQADDYDECALTARGRAVEILDAVTLRFYTP
jgi:hypothetical protein